jgi:hypothetical protein
MMAGRWRVSMNTSDVSLHPSEVEVVAGMTSHVELRLEPNIRVNLVFTNPARDDVEVEAFDAGGTRFFKRTYLAPEGEATDEVRPVNGQKEVAARSADPGQPPRSQEGRRQGGRIHQLIPLRSPPVEAGDVEQAGQSH